MNLINNCILWVWILGISLLIPTSLPAGGVNKILIEKREDSMRSPLIVFNSFDLLSTTEENPIILTLF